MRHRESLSRVIAGRRSYGAGCAVNGAKTRLSHRLEAYATLGAIVANASSGRFGETTIPGLKPLTVLGRLLRVRSLLIHLCESFAILRRRATFDLALNNRMVAASISVVIYFVLLKSRITRRKWLSCSLRSSRESCYASG